METNGGKIENSNSKKKQTKSYEKEDLAYELEQIIKDFDPYNADLLKEFLKANYEYYEEVINGILKNKESNVVISYGNNCYVSKLLINKILDEKFPPANDQEDYVSNYLTITFNSHIHTTEEIIIKKLCEEILQDKTIGFDKGRKKLEDHYKSKSKTAKKMNEKLIVIYFENIDHLFTKKKQTLIYTLLELVSISPNILLCGMTANCDLVENMEKRIRSRFSQNMIHIKLPDENIFLQTLALLFGSNTSYYREYLDVIFKNLLQSKDEDLKYNFILLIQKYVYSGNSVKEIMTKIKYILTMILIKLPEIQDKFEEQIKSVIKQVLVEHVQEELSGPYFNLLKNFSKLHIVLLMCLWISVYKFKNKITIAMIYEQYTNFCKGEGSMTRLKLDMIVVKKALEELYNSNLIHIKNDEKYLQVYELKLHYEYTQELLLRLDELNGYNNFDGNMKNFMSGYLR